MENRFERFQEGLNGHTWEKEVSKQNLYSHLKEGVKPIMASIGSFDDYDDLKMDHPEFANIDNDLGLNSATNVNWHADSKALEESGQLNAGKYTYVISKIDSTDKLSKEFGGCTGLVVTGTDRESGEDVSFMTHQNLEDMMTEARKNEKEQFLKHLEERFAEIKNRCIPGTVDVVIVGGNQWNSRSNSYSSVITLLNEEVKREMGFEPVVLGPKVKGVYDNVYYQNKDRKLFLVRSEVHPKVTPFLGGQVEEKRKEWN